MNKVGQWLRDLPCKMGWCFGYGVSAYDKRGNLWMGFRCLKCGRVRHKALNGRHPEPRDEDFS